MCISKLNTLIFFVLFQNILLAQNHLSTKMVEDDLMFLRKNIKEISINPFDRFSENKFNLKIDSIENSLIKKRNINSIDLYKSLQPIISYLKDGHTEVSNENLLENEDYYLFPYQIDCSLNSIKTKELKSNYLESYNNIRNQNIIKINRFTQKEISKLLGLYNSGETEILRIKYGELFFNELFNLLLNKGENFVNIEFENGDKQKIKLIKSSNWHQPNNQASQEANSYSYYISKNQAVLNFRKFNDVKNFRKFLESMFKEIKEKKVQNLIIDISNNGGGNSELGDELLKYFLNQPFSQYEKTLIKYSEQSKNYFSKLTDINPVYLKEYLIQPDGMINVISKKKELIMPHENEKRFLGKVFLITNSRTYSSAADFAQAFKYYNVGKIVGIETGGQVISKGEAIKIQLPNSKIYVYISSSIDYNIGTSENDYIGVKPDYEIDTNKALEYITSELIE